MAWKPCTLLWTICLCTVSAMPALAGEGGNPMLNARIGLLGGAFFSFIDTNLRLDASDGDFGTEIDVEELLGMDDTKTTPFGGLWWRITPRHRLSAEYFELSRNGHVSATRDIEWGDVTFPVGASLDSHYRWKVGRVAYRYSFVNDGEKELGLALGLHIAEVAAKLSGEVTAGDAGVRFSTESGEVTLPLPNVGLVGAYAFNDRLAASLDATGFYLSVDDLTGWIVRADASVTYHPFAHVGFGAAYSLFNVSYEDKSDNGHRFRAEQLFHGPRIYAVVTF